MPKFNFIQYHYKAMNAATEEEKTAINMELKALYESLNEEDKKVFNEELQHFLVHEYSKIASMGQQINNNESLN